MPGALDPLGASGKAGPSSSARGRDVVSEPSALARAELPRGFVDRDALDIAAPRDDGENPRRLWLYGFEAVETPFVEFTEALGKFLPDLIGRTKACSRFRTTTTVGFRCATI